MDKDNHSFENEIFLFSMLLWVFVVVAERYIYMCVKVFIEDCKEEREIKIICQAVHHVIMSLMYYLQQIHIKK